MDTLRARTRPLVTLLLLAACGAAGPVPTPSAAPTLGGTSWRLVQFRGGDDTTLTPDDKGKYTLEFRTDGRLAARIDCNRGTGTWKSSGPNQLELGPMALTRAMCPPGSLHDRIAKHLTFVRSYVVKDGHLFLSLMADGGIYEFEPIPGAKSVTPRLPVARRGPIPYECTQAGGGSETLSAAFYQTKPAMVLVERRGRARPAFQVPSASGAKYEGEDVTFWEAPGEASLTWSGARLICKRS